MVIKKKVTRKANPHVSTTIADEEAINKVINRGGKTTTENHSIAEVEARFTLRLPAKMIDSIDKQRSKRAGSFSRNQWIVEAISDKLSPK